MTQHPSFGDFDFQTVVGTFEPQFDEMVPWQQRFGLALQVQYIYGGFADANGTKYAIERKFVGPMTGGAWLMSDEAGYLALQPGALRSVRGETIRKFSDSSRVWGNHLMHGVGQKVAPSGDQPLHLEMGGDKLAWAEGELFELGGSLLGPGVQFYAPMREEPLFYTTHAYWVNGTILGTEVEGFVGFDHGYWLHGREWKEYRIFQDLEVAWQVFANQFDGGAVEWGLILRGRRGLDAGVVLEGDRLVAKTNDMAATFDLDDEGDINEATFTIGEHQWRFRGDERGKMRQFTEARWAGYRSQGGVTRRDGDERVLRNGFSWIEFFPERIRDDGLLVG